MNLKVKICAVFLLISMLISLASCVNTNSNLPDLDENIIVMSYGDYTINEKEFMYILTNVKTEVVMLYEYYYGYSEEQTMSLKSGDLTVADAIMDEAINRAQRILVIEKLAAEAGITISNQDDIVAIEEYISNIEYAYGGKDLFDIELIKFGFTREGIKRVAENSLLESLILEQRYGQNGLAKIPSETVNKEFIDNFIAYEAGAFSYVNESAAGYIKYDFSNTEILDYYKENYVRVCQILYNEENKSDAESDLQKLQNGELKIEDLKSKNESIKYEFVFTHDSSNFGEKFETAAFEMNVGDIKLVESESGWHLVEKVALDTTVFDGNDASSTSAKDDVVINMSRDKIKREAESLLVKLNSGELTAFPEKVEGFSNYVQIEKSYISKNTSEYKDRLDVISALKSGEYGIYNSKTEGVYIYKRVDFTEEDITSEIYTEIETALITAAFTEYYSSYFDSIEIKNDIIAKFDVVTMPLLEEDFYMVG